MGKFYQKYFQCRPQLSEAEYARSRKLFVAEAGVVPFMSVAWSGTYLAALLNMLGASEALSGVLLSLAAFAALMQLFVPIFSGSMRNKKMLGVFTVLFSRVCGVLMLMLPSIFGIGKGTLLLCSILLFFYVFVGQFYVPLEATWLMRLLPLSIRGEYLGRKDALNYVCVAVASYVCGAVLDYFEAGNALRTGFFIIGVVSAVCCCVSFVFQLNIADPQPPAEKKRPRLREMLSACIGNARFYELMKTTVLYDLVLYSSLAYLSIYVITQLQVSYLYISIVTFACVVIKALAAPLWGKLAGKKSFACSAKYSGYVLLFSYLLWALTMKENSMWMYPVSMFFNAVGMSGAAFSVFAIKFDIALPEEQDLFISVGNAVSGVGCFIIALLASLFVDRSGTLSLDLGFVHIGNMQILFLVSALFCLLFCLYVGAKKKQG